jgi:type IV pilus assembly protein PilM
MGLKRSSKFERYGIWGLDIGSSQIKLVQLRKDQQGYAVTAAATAEIEGSDLSDSDKDAKNDGKVVGAIQRCIGTSETQDSFAVCGVCGPEVAVRYFNFPSLPTAELDGAVRLEAEQVCPFSIEHAAVDYQLTSRDEKNVSGVMVAATDGLVKRKRNLAKAASLRCALIDVDGLALLNCLEGFAGNVKAPKGTCAILNIGNRYTTLALRSEKGLPFIRDIAYAGSHIVEHIAEENNIPAEKVLAILSGKEKTPQAQSVLGKSLVGACHRLVVDVNETLRYYATQEKSALVETILVCGGFSLVEGFVDILSNELSAKTVLWNPFESARCDAGQPVRDILAQKGPAMAVAAGLAMRSI